MQMSFARRAQRRAPARHGAHHAEPLEPRLCLATFTIPFLASNYSLMDTGFGSQAPTGTNIRAVEVGVPPGLEFDVPSYHYEPFGFGEARMTWPEPRTMQRASPTGGEAMATANAFVSISATLRTAHKPATTASVMADITAIYASGGWTTVDEPAQHIINWTIQGGAFDGKSIQMLGLETSHRRVVVNDPTMQLEDRVTDFLFPAGWALNGDVLYFHVIAGVGSSVLTTDPETIPLQDAGNTLFQAPSARAWNDRTTDGIKDGMKYKGAIPDTLLLYDFSGDATPSPAIVPYVGQYEQTTVPSRFGVPGGNACGPSALTMLLSAVGQPTPIAQVYDNTMQLGLSVPPDTPQEFVWTKGRDYLRGRLAGTHGVTFTWGDNWQNIEANLAAGNPVVLGTNLGQELGPGTGHVMLVLGIGTKIAVQDGLRQLYPGSSGDYYIVADPAGNFFGDHTHAGFNTGHYGTINGLRAQAKGINNGGWFAVYPKEELQARVSPVRTITISPVAPAADVTVHSPVTVVITDPLGRRSGILTDGSILDEIPGGNYQVAVGEEFGSNTRTFDPEREKGVVLSAPMNGTYQVELVGTGSGPFTLNVNLLVPGAPPFVTTYTGTASPGSVHRYSFGFPPSAAPVVERVYLSGSTWAPAFKQALAALSAGSAQFGFALPATDQLDERPWANADQVSITFDRDVVVDASDLRVTGVNTPVYTLDPAGFSYVAATRTATWRLAAGKSFRNDRILLDLDGDGPGGVKTAAGVFLDGDWINPVGAAAGGDAFPSGDGTPGGDFRFRFHVLRGDADRNGAVNARDVLGARARLGVVPYGVFHDADADGRITVRDVVIGRAMLGQELPDDPAPASALVAPTARRARPSVRDLLAG